MMRHLELDEGVATMKWDTVRLVLPLLLLLSLGTVPAAVRWLPVSATVPEPPPAREQATPGTPACRGLSPAWVELGAGVGENGSAVSRDRVYSVSDGTLAVLVITTAVNDEGAPIALDFVASLGVDAAIVESDIGATVYRYQPPALSGAGLSGPAERGIRLISFCYRSEASTAPTPGTPIPPAEVPKATVAVRATQTAAVRATATTIGSLMATATAALENAAQTAAANGSAVAEAQATVASVMTTATREAIAQTTAEARAEREAMATMAAAATQAASIAAELATADAQTTAAAAAAQATVTSLVGQAAALELTVAAQATRISAASTTATARAASDATAEARAASGRATAQTEATAAQATIAGLSTQQALAARTATAGALPTATATPSFVPPATPVPDVLYAADTAREFDGWDLPPGWTREDGTLAADGTSSEWAVPTYQVEDLDDYAVEAEIRVVSEPDCQRNFGIGARGTDAGYVAAGVEWRCRPAASLWAGQDLVSNASFDPGRDWHTYRLEVRGDTIKLFIDGVLVVEATDDRYPSGGEVALWSNGVRLNVRSFVVTTLPPRS
ncbi:MAG TPA: DUF1080 domain-containing protein [Thermomicrobiales bacterium]|nr:DUF1080 domain-containing protein [Thermomicrobiales bacterium]